GGELRFQLVERCVVIGEMRFHFAHVGFARIRIAAFELTLVGGGGAKFRVGGGEITFRPPKQNKRKKQGAAADGAECGPEWGFPIHGSGSCCFRSRRSS